MAKDKRTERLKRIKAICDGINKGPHGGDNHDALVFLGQSEAKALERFSTGARKLDSALGGGWPRGRICEVYGPESGGKSTICLHAIAEFQKKYPDEDVAIIDSEFSFDVAYASDIGVDVELLIVHQPETGEQALNILEQLIMSDVGMVVVDSVAALTPKAELEGDIGDSHVANTARLMSQGLRKIIRAASMKNSFVLFTNQVRAKIGVMFGKKTTEPGGNALKFYASCRVEIVRIGSDKEGDDKVANRVKAVVTKNKTAAPFREAHFAITFGLGIDSVVDILDAALESNVVQKSGSWFNHGKTRLGQGRAKTLELLRENPEMIAQIEAEVVEKEKTAALPKKTARKARTESEESAESEESVESGESAESEESVESASGSRSAPALDSSIFDEGGEAVAEEV